MTFLLLVSSGRSGACTHVLCITSQGSHWPKELAGSFTVPLQVWQSRSQRRDSRGVCLWALCDRKTAPNEVAASTHAGPHVPLSARGAARLSDRRDAVAHGAAALRQPRSADDAGPRTRRGRAGVLASAPAYVRAFHRRSACGVEDRLHDLAV